MKGGEVTRRTVAWIVAAVVVAVSCRDEPRETPPAAGDRVSPEQNPEVVFAEEAEAVVDSFLTLSVPNTVLTPHSWDSIWACPPDGPAGVSYWIAGYELLSVDIQGDTAVVAAEVTSVAEQRESSSTPYGSVVSPRTRIDTLHWEVVRFPSGRPGVCGFARERVDLGMYGTPQNTEYREGVTREELLRRIDSIIGRRR
jgi:hypothetical protein